MQTGKELLVASRPYAQEQRLKSWWCLWSTLIGFAAAFIVACAPLPWFVYVPSSILAALFLVRLFIIYHDYMHGAILRGSLVAKCLMHSYGLLALSPPHVWKHSHDDHHKKNCKYFGSALGSFPLMTTEEYARASFWQRFGYAATRHPLTIALGYLTTFLWSMCLYNFLTNPKKHYLAGLAIVIHVGAGVCLALVSIQALLWGMLVPLTIAGAIGSYVFYAQHNFPGMSRHEGSDWDHAHAALHSSSFMRMGPLMHWFTGNIGFHHVHHLNAKIPFYRLPEAMAGIKELQSPVNTSLNPVDVMRCLRLKLWDPVAERPLTFAEANRQTKCV